MSYRTQGPRSSSSLFSAAIRHFVGRARGRRKQSLHSNGSAATGKPAMPLATLWPSPRSSPRTLTAEFVSALWRDRLRATTLWLHCAWSQRSLPQASVWRSFPVTSSRHKRPWKGFRQPAIKFGHRASPQKRFSPRWTPDTGRSSDHRFGGGRHPRRGSVRSHDVPGKGVQMRAGGVVPWPCGWGSGRRLVGGLSQVTQKLTRRRAPALQRITSVHWPADRVAGRLRPAAAQSNLGWQSAQIGSSNRPMGRRDENRSEWPLP